jgi:DNA-binding beta-propeller fold protein YncE
VWRHIAVCLCFASMTSACAGAPTALPVNGTASTARGEAKQPALVYASNFLNGDVYAYRSSGRDKHPVQTIRGLSASIGLFVDRARHLYVAQQSTVLEFSSTGQQIKTYDDAGHSPLGVAKCPSGTLYVANSEGDTISVYAHGATQPTGTIVDGGTQVFHLGCDTKNDLFVSVGGKKGQVDEFPAGSAQPVNLPIHLAFPEGIQADAAGDVVVAASSSIDFYHVGDRDPFRSIAVKGGVLEISFERGDTEVWATGGNGLERYEVATGRRTDRISGSNFGGLAASPP